MKTEVGKGKPIDAFLEGIRFSLQKRRAGKVALLSIVLLSFLLILGIWLLYWANFRSGVVSPLRLLLGAAVLAAVGAAWLFWKQKIAPLRVARYVEEKNPHLQQRLITAVERGEHAGNPLWPLLEEDVLRSTRSVRLESALEAQRPWMIAALAAIGLTCALFLLGPSFFRYGLGKLLAFSSAAKPLYEIAVLPGNVRIAPGMDQEIQASPAGFDPDQIVLFYKFNNQPQWEKAPMERAASRGEKAREGVSFSHLLMDIREPVQYYVEAQKIRSPGYRIDVADWPRVEKISLQYFYPAYTGLKTRKVEDGGDIQAIRGTRVRVEVQFNEQPQKPQLFLEGKRQAFELSGQDGKHYSGELTVEEDDQYWVRINSPEGDVRSSKAHEIVALEDRPPLVRFNRPGRDQRVSRLEEVPTQLEAEDDFGLRSVQLNYSVNGGKEKSITLFGPGAARHVKKDYTFYLEEMNVQPGDFIAYYGAARDAVSASKTDMYFLEVKPFEREYYQNQSGSGQGGGQQEDRMLSRRQKEIIAGTWKVLQEEKKKSREERTENLKTLALVQHRLQQQAESILERLMRRQGAFSDTTGQQMIESLQQAARLMEPAHQNLSREQAATALSYEQQALQKLLRAEALMKEVQVSWGMGSQGVGGDSRAEELADLFDLERDQMKNQYETLQQSQPGQQRDPKTDEALQKLKELARRQQQSLQQGSSAAEQRRLQQETEELARQLERLSRQRRNPQMDEIARQLNEASQNMQSSMQGQGSAAAGSRALDQLRRAQSQLSQMQQQTGERELSQLNQAAENLVRHQEEVEARVSSMQQRGGASAREVMRLLDDKEGLRRQLRSLEQELDEAARRNSAAQRKASQDLRSAANEIRDRRLEDKVRQGGSLIYRGLLDQARQREQSLVQEFRELQNLVAEAQQEAQGARSAGNGNPNADSSRLQRALQETGRLLDQLEQIRRGQQPGGKPESAGQRGKGQPEKGAQASSSSQQSENSQQGNSQNAQRNPSTGQQQTGNNQESNSERGGRNSSRGQQAGNSQQNSSQNGNASASSSRGEGGITDSAGPFSGSPNRGIRPDAPVNPMNESEWRQFWGERMRDVQDIQRSLSGDRELARQVADLLERMRQLDNQRSLQDPQEVARLQSSIIQGFRALELKMSLRLQGRKENLQLFNQEEVPLEYRKAVEEYYKSLARSKGNTGK